jgi:hypothetical protein
VRHARDRERCRILIAWKRAPWLWARVAGDALDIVTAAKLRREENRPPRRRGAAADKKGAGFEPAPLSPRTAL